MTTLRPNAQRAKNAIIFIWAVMALDIASLVSSYLQYGLLKSADLGAVISEDTASANDDREMLIGIVYLLVYIASVVVFIQWFRRAYFNLHLRVPNLSHTEGWAAGAWFVPILTWFKPYQIMRELFVRTAELLKRRGVEHRPAPIGLIGWWWAAWVIGSVLGQISFRTAMNAETLNELIFTTGVSMIESLVGIPLAILAVQVVKRYAGMEALLAQLPEESVPPVPPEFVLPAAPDPSPSGMAQ